MADRGFNSVFVLIAVCICAELDVAMLQNPPSSKYPGFYKQNDKGDFGIRMVWAEDILGIHIYFDSQTDSAKSFFKSDQITSKITNGLAFCKKVRFFFHPCSISKINNEKKLVCPKDPSQCDTNKYQSCVVNNYGYQDNAATIKFLSCNISGKTTDECAKECKMDGDSLKACAGSIGDSFCNDFYGNFDLIKKNPVEAEVANAKKYSDPFTKFGEVLCKGIKDCSLECTNICN